jgi:cytochrome oxidase assembly protein ShyY1
LNYLKLSYRRWLAWLALAAAFAVACSFLSNWQFARRAQVLAVIAQLDANYDRQPLSLNEVTSVKKQKWMPVSLTGSYLPESALLVRNRSNNGNPGFEQLVPFQTSSKIVFVDRGWIPTGNSQDAPDQNPLPSSGPVSIVGHVMPSEARLDRSAPRGQIAMIDIYLAAHLLHIKPEAAVRSFFLTLASETPRSKNQPVLLPKPELDEGNHLSYAFQWILFALMAFGALYWAVRKEYEEYRIATDPNYQPKPKRASRSQKDEQSEDELVEAILSSKK